MTEINKQPVALSNFLGVQAGGRNPDDLSQVVRPVIDIEPFYTPDRLRAAVEPYSMSKAQIEFIEVPANEFWKVINFSINITTMSVSQIASFVFGTERIPGQGLNGVPWVSATLGPHQNAITGNDHWASDVVPRILTPGQRITCSYYDGDRVTCDGFFWVTYVLLDRGR